MKRRDYNNLANKMVSKPYANTIKNLQEYLDKFGTLWLQGYKHDDNISIKDFIISLLDVNNIVAKSYATVGKFEDRVRASQVSGKGYRRYRSLGDIYLISKRYYPDITLTDVCRILNQLCKEENNFTVHYCGVIRKRVFGINNRINHYRPTENSIDYRCEFHLQFPYKVSEM